MPPKKSAATDSAPIITADPIAAAQADLDQALARRSELDAERESTISRHAEARAEGRRARIGGDEAAATAAGARAREAEAKLGEVDDALFELTEIIAASETQLAAARDAALRATNSAAITTAVQDVEAVLAEATEHLRQTSRLQAKLFEALPVFGLGIDERDRMMTRRETAAEIVRRAIERPDHDAVAVADYLLLRRLRLLAAEIADGSGSPHLPDPAAGQIFDPFPLRRDVVASQSFRWLDIQGRPDALLKGSTRSLPEPLAKAAIDAGVAKEVKPRQAFSETGPQLSWTYQADAAAELAARQAEFAKVFPGPWKDPGTAVDLNIDLRVEAEKSLQAQRSAYIAELAA